MVYLVKIRMPDGFLLTYRTIAHSAEQAVKSLENHTQGIARSVWLEEWTS